jgi:hypothetical protein
MTKEDFRDAVLWMKYEFPKVCTERYNLETQLRKENPFWPFNPLLKKSSTELKNGGKIRINEIDTFVIIS